MFIPISQMDSEPCQRQAEKIQQNDSEGLSYRGTNSDDERLHSMSLVVFSLSI